MVVRPWGFMKEKGLFCVGRCGVEHACICGGGRTYIGGLSTAAGIGGGRRPRCEGGRCLLVVGGWWLPSVCCRG